MPVAILVADIMAPYTSSCPAAVTAVAVVADCMISEPIVVAVTAARTIPYCAVAVGAATMVEEAVVSVAIVVAVSTAPTLHSYEGAVVEMPVMEEAELSVAIVVAVIVARIPPVMRLGHVGSGRNDRISGMSGPVAGRHYGSHPPQLPRSRGSSGRNRRCGVWPSHSPS